MASERRIGGEDSKSRAVLLDAALSLMLDEGYASVTSRKVAARAGLKPQLVHYYFRTMDDLFLALFRRGAERNLERQAAALASDQPLWALWDFSNEPAGTALYMEFAALANHRTAIRAEIAAYAERFRQQQLDALSSVLAAREADGDGDELSPVAFLVLMTAVSRTVAMEEGLGMSQGHAEAWALIERRLTVLEGPRR
jgi:AcrR family transcriptional regulator